MCKDLFDSRIPASFGIEAQCGLGLESLKRDERVNLFLLRFDEVLVLHAIANIHAPVVYDFVHEEVRVMNLNK